MIPSGRLVVPAKKDAGFTLIEMLVALTILSVAIGLGVTLLRHEKSRSSEVVARSLERFLLAARQSAITDGRPSIVRLDAPKNAVTSPGTSNRVQIGDSISWRAEVGLAGMTSQSAEIVFLGDGSSSGGAIYLTGADGSYVITTHWLGGLTDVRRLR